MIRTIAPARIRFRHATPATPGSARFHRATPVTPACARVQAAAVALLLCLAVISSGAVTATAGELVVQDIGVERGDLAVHVTLVDAFDADTRSNLASGLPITVRFTTELWRHRGRWWDKQLASRVLSYQIRWDPGEQVYLLGHPGPRRRDSYDELGQVLDEVSDRVLAVYGRWSLEDRHRYFVAVEAAIRPLTLEEFRELDGWIGGKIRGRTDDTSSEETAESEGGGIAQAFFGLLLDLSGFGDTILKTRTPLFRPAELGPLPE